MVINWFTNTISESKKVCVNKLVSSVIFLSNTEELFCKWNYQELYRYLLNIFWEKFFINLKENLLCLHSIKIVIMDFKTTTDKNKQVAYKKRIIGDGVCK